MNTQSLQLLEHILKISVQRHGADKPLTLGHLKNIVAMAINKAQAMEAKEERDHRQIMKDITPSPGA